MNELEEILKACCKITGVELDMVKIKNRNTTRVQCRQLCCYFADKKGYTLEQIGSVINRDHATVLHGKREIAKYLSINDQLTTKYVQLIKNQLQELNLAPENNVNPVVYRYTNDLKRLNLLDLRRLLRKIKAEIDKKNEKLT